ncbi:MAG: hypothetical protein LCH79_16315 [Proteobacteria bacterium]|nr:hypothetical protein [Pseudomonadota bacterium]
MQVSIVRLYEDGKRLSDYQIRIAKPVCGWLVLKRVDVTYREGFDVRLLSDAGVDVLPAMERAQVVEAKFKRGMLIVGIQYRSKGKKHSISDRQAWWCEAPPRALPLLDNDERIRAAVKAYDESWEGSQMRQPGAHWHPDGTPGGAGLSG